MSPTTLAARLREALGDRLAAVRERSARRVCVDAAGEDVPEISRRLLGELGARLQTATGVDAPPDEVEILYHWALDAQGCVVTVCTRLDRARPALESLAPFCPAAEWIEREIRELLGVEFLHHPDPRHLLLADDWPEGQYPLRRDYRRPPVGDGP